MKKVLIGIAGVVLLLGVISLFLPSAVAVTRTASINAPASVVFGQVNDFHNWVNWDPWQEKDPDMKATYEGPESGTGSKRCWESDNEDVGKGCLTILESVDNSSVKTKLEFEGMGPGFGNWTFEEIDGATTVSWGMDMDMGMNPIGKFMGLMMDGMLGPDFEKGLATLKGLCEDMPTEEAKPAIDAQKVTVEALPIYSIKDSAMIQDLAAKMNENYTAIAAHVEASSAEVTGPTLCIWHNWNPKGYSTFECGMQVAEAGSGTDAVSASETYSGNAVTTTHLGSYESSEATYFALEDYMEAEGHTVIGAPWEIYTVGPKDNPDTTAWVTEIYFPVE
ncbi:MAG: SRPBCC family protein [Flavobacteriales bacterium]|nr:SRPBCC family protein [Flavobacteriales bacterium]